MSGKEPKTAPRVLVSGVVLGQPMGGVRRHNEELLPRVAARLEVMGGSLAILEGRTPIPFELPPSIERIQSNVPYQPAPMRAAFESKALASALSGAAKAGRPFDFVHTAHHPAPRGLSVPYTLTLHDLRSLDLDSAPFVRRHIGGRVVRRAILDAHRIGVVSKWMSGCIVEVAGPQATGIAERITLIGNGADHLPLLPRSPTEPPFLLHVGHVEPRKNLEALVRALALDTGLPRVLLAGRAAGPEWARLQDLAQELGVQDRLERIEPKDNGELAQLYARAACAVFPSKLEGFGIGPVEALRAGTPTAISAIPAHLEVAANAGCNPPFGFDPADVRALIDGVRRAMSAPPFEASLATWDDCADRWVSLWTK